MKSETISIIFNLILFAFHLFVLHGFQQMPDGPFFDGDKRHVVHHFDFAQLVLLQVAFFGEEADDVHFADLVFFSGTYIKTSIGRWGRKFQFPSHGIFLTPFKTLAAKQEKQYGLLCPVEILKNSLIS